MTTRFTTVIVDDERWAREKIRRHLNGVPWIEVVGEAGDGEAALALSDDLRPDVIFLDIEMPGPDGLQVADSLPYRPAVVFTTAHASYAVSAFEVRAVDYLLKPFGAGRLNDALERVRDVLETRASARGERDDQAEAEEPLTRLFVRHRGRIVPVSVKEVIRFEARDDYVMIHTLDGGSHLASIRMHELERRLDPAQHLRIHRSHIVNLEHVVGFASHKSGRLQVRLQDGTELFVSRARSKDLRRHAV